MKLNTMVLIALATSSLSLFSMEEPNEERGANRCTLWPCSQYDFCPNPYSDNGCCYDRKDLSKKMCALCITPSLLVKAAFWLHYFQNIPIGNVQEACTFVMTGDSSFYPPTLATELCCLCTDATLLGGTMFIGCALSPCINQNGWNCCVKKKHLVLQELQEDNQMHYPPENRED